MSRKKKEAFWIQVISMALLTSPLLLVAGGFQIAAYFYGRKSTELTTDGLLATATVFEVTKDRLGEGLSANSEYQRGTSPGHRSQVQHWTLHYRFVTQSDSEVTGSYNVQTYKQPQLGQTLDVRYLPSNPTVHETAVGHTQSQDTALRWIAFAFAGIWFACLLWIFVSGLIPKKLSTRERRLARSQAIRESDSTARATSSAHD